MKTLILALVLALVLGFAIHVSEATATTPAIFEPSLPVVKSISGEPVTPKAGQQVVISLEVKSNADDARKFVTIMEVRDSSGITKSLAWHQGYADPGSHATTGISWIAEKEGSYQVRAFVLSGLQNPQVYSAVVSSDFNVLH